MKKLFLFFCFLCLLSCSSDGGSSSGNDSGNLTFNGINYPFDKIYVLQDEASGYQIAIAKGEMTFDLTIPNTTQVTYSSDFKRLLYFLVRTKSSSLNSGTYVFPIIPVENQNIYQNKIFFRDDYQIENGDDTSFNTIFNDIDNTSTQSRVVITKSENDKYTFDFNVITTAGTLTGTYTGTIIKVNY